MAGDTSSSRSHAAAEAIDDNISLTSTIDEDFDSDEEWPVNSILAESEIDGEVRYLSEWAGFPLSSASWEPRSHFQEGLLKDWESSKEKQRRGQEPKFLISQWRKAVIDHWSAKFARHEARNRKRVAAGQSTTVWDQSIRDIMATLDELPKDEPEEVKEGPTSSRNNDTLKVSQVAKIQEARHGQQPETCVSDLQRRHTTQATISAPNIPKRPPLQMLSVAEPNTEQRRHSLSTPRGRDKPVVIPARRRPPPVPGQTVNVFAGGKVRNSAQNLPSAAADPEKQPKIPRARFQRLIKKGQRDKEGTVAPPRMPNTLISLDPKNPGIVCRQNEVADTVESDRNVDEGDNDDAMDIDSTSSDDSDDIPIIQPRRRKESSTNTKDQTQIISNADDAVGVDRIISDDSDDTPIMRSRRPKVSSPNTKNPKPIMSNNGKSQKRNRKKVVFWVNQDEANSTPMPDAVESSLFVADGKSHDEVSAMVIDHGDDESMAAIPRLDNLSLKSHNSEPSNRKSCRMGLHAKERFFLTFDGIPTKGNFPGLSEFLVQEELVFTHTCNAHDYLQQLNVGELIEVLLANGSVSVAEESDSFNHLVERLRLSSFGLICHATACCVLLYPAKSEEWEHEGAVGTIGTAAASSSRLCYSIFNPTARFISDHLRQHAHFTLTPSTTASSRTATSFFDQGAYETLLPLHKPQVSAQQTARDSFCLVFPPSAQHDADLLLQWLQLSNPNNDLRCSLVPGHWRSFLKRSYGTVILHEDTLGSIYRMPSISNLLHTRGDHYSFWVLRRPLSRLSLPQSMALSHMDRSGLVFERIFRPGVAILVPPSFLLSQPKQAYNFFKWFWQNFSSTAHVYRRGRLVMCANIADWLLALASQRAREAGPGESDGSIEIRFKSAALVRSLIAESADSPSCPIVCAPENIDGHDEQSLVNWFGWWSLTQADCFRKFSFICSDSDCQESLTRVVSPPVFNEASIKAQLSMRSETSKTPELVPDETGGSLARYVENIEYRVLSGGYWKPLVLYRFPVAQRDNSVESRAYSNYGGWIQFYLSRVLPKVMRTAKLGGGVKTTYVGLFHTKGSSSGPNSMSDSGSRQPWIAILRPAGLNRRPLKSLELLIWDIRMKEKVKSVESIASADLSPPQQELIDEVAAITEGSQDCLPLERVWVGGSKSSHRLSHPVDKTLDFLEALLCSYKDWLPFDPDNLEGRGWRHVSQLTRPPASYGLANDRGTGEQDIQKMVFDPPTPSPDIPPPKCKNRLCQWALDNPAGKDATFTFVPTMEWYKEQVDAGYGYEHVKAVGWKAFFELYKITDPDDRSAKN